jgi:ribosomal protein S18 acetylase RimI-like enzyme
MKLVQRQFSGEADKYEMAALAKQFAEDNLHVIDLPYRFSSWSLEDPENVALWVDEEQRLVGWAIIQSPFWTIDYACQPGAESQLYGEILAWADRRARATWNTPAGHPAWYVMVFEEQTQRIRKLERAGFACQADVGENPWSMVLMRRSTDTAVRRYEPPSGFVVRSLAGEEEVEDYVVLHRSVFESKNMNRDWRARTLNHPAYRHDLDIVVEAPGGQLVAFCIGWFNETSMEGQIEPLGCHKNFRHYALGRVALSECLYRLQSLGAKNIFVETDSYRNTAFRLYESFDFRAVRNILVYRKDYSP